MGTKKKRLGQTRQDVEILVKTSRDNIPAGIRFPGHPKKNMGLLNPWLKRAEPP